MMIKSFKHKGLKQLFENGIISGIPAQDAVRINDRLQAIDSATMIDDLNIYIYKLHLPAGRSGGDLVNNSESQLAYYI